MRFKVGERVSMAAFSLIGSSSLLISLMLGYERYSGGDLNGQKRVNASDFSLISGPKTKSIRGNNEWEMNRKESLFEFRDALVELSCVNTTNTLLSKYGIALLENVFFFNPLAWWMDDQDERERPRFVPYLPCSFRQKKKIYNQPSTTLQPSLIFSTLETKCPHAYVQPNIRILLNTNSSSHVSLQPI